LAIVALALMPSLASPTAAQDVVRGLDHLPVAVKDLERSAADFEALGFAVKPGRPHANGLRNVHLKFPDGTEIELITAPAATDALSSLYHDWLKGGDGPVFLGLYAPDLGKLTEHLSRVGVSLDRTGDLGTIVEPPDLRRLFFARRQRSPTDRPEHFEHKNTAVSLTGIWLAGGTAEQRLLKELGAEPASAVRCGPLGPSVHVLAMPEGDVMFLPAALHLPADRSIVAASVAVRNLEAVRSLFDSRHIPYDQPAACDGRSLWVGPTAAHGLWLEFRQYPMR
jgi:hypothetical protein